MNEAESWQAEAETPPELDLWRCVLILAIQDLKLPPGHRNYSGRWFESRDAGPGSFEWVAEVLDFDPTTARKRIAEFVLSTERRAA